MSARKSDRKLFAFRCDVRLGMRIRALAAGLKTQIGSLVEHITGLGMEYLCLRLERDGEAQVQELQKLHDHLQHEHIQVDRLDHDERILLVPDDLSEDRSAEYRAIKNLVDEYRQVGVPCEIVLKMVSRFTANLEHQRRIDAKRMELAHQVDLRALARLQTKFPRLIPAITHMLNTCTEAEVGEILQSYGPRRRRRRR